MESPQFSWDLKEAPEEEKDREQHHRCSQGFSQSNARASNVHSYLLACAQPLWLLSAFVAGKMCPSSDV